MTVQVVILAAGMGTRLARPHPKPLTRLIDGRTIIQQQVDNLRQAFGEDWRLTIVVGYKMEQVMEHMPNASFVYNENYDQTNTSKSLLKALRNSAPGGVLWMNGDVVFDPDIFHEIRALLEADSSFICVDRSTVSTEEVKYTVSSTGNIQNLSKKIPLDKALGEAVGINYVSGRHKESLTKRLELVAETDYFEAAIEQLIALESQHWIPAKIGRHYAVEIDFHDDLARANRALENKTL